MDEAQAGIGVILAARAIRRLSDIPCSRLPKKILDSRVRVNRWLCVPICPTSPASVACNQRPGNRASIPMKGALRGRGSPPGMAVGSGKWSRDYSIPTHDRRVPFPFDLAARRHVQGEPCCQHEKHRRPPQSRPSPLGSFSLRSCSAGFPCAGGYEDLHVGPRPSASE